MLLNLQQVVGILIMEPNTRTVALLKMPSKVLLSRLACIFS